MKPRRFSNLAFVYQPRNLVIPFQPGGGRPALSATLMCTIRMRMGCSGAVATPIIRGLHSFPFPLNLSLVCPFPLNLSLLCPPHDPN